MDLMSRSIRVVEVFCLVALMLTLLVPFASADWFMFHSNPSHTGVGMGAPVLAPTVLWNYSTPGTPVDSSPVVANGVVYVGLNGLNPDGSVGGVYAFGALNGTVLWYYKAYDVSSSPAVVDGVVYIDAEFYVLALNATNGLNLWTFDTIDQTFSSPTVVNGVVYVGCNSLSDCLYALNASNGAQIWNCTFREDVETSPTVCDGVIYISPCGWDGILYALNATTGTELWTCSTFFDGSPAVAYGMVYAGSTCFGGFCAWNATTGELIWNLTETAFEPLVSVSSPAVQDGVVYMCDGDRVIYALDAFTGTEFWNFTNGSFFDSSPAVAGGLVYIGASSGDFFALNASDGSLVWNFATPRFGENGCLISSSPAVDNGIVYFGSFYGCLYALGALSTAAPTSTPTAASTTAPTQEPSLTPTQTIQPTPTPVPTSATSVTPQPTSNPTSITNQTTTQTPNASTAPTLTSATFQAKIDNGSTVELSICGNITSSQISNIAIETNLSIESTTVSFTVTGATGTSGFCNMTIPKSAVVYGTVPTIYVDGQPAQAQGCTQDDDNYYVWFTIHFSTHQISIEFTTTVNNAPSQNPTTSPSQNKPKPTLLLQGIYAAADLAIVAAGATVYIWKKGPSKKVGKYFSRQKSLQKRLNQKSC